MFDVCEARGRDGKDGFFTTREIRLGHRENGALADYTWRIERKYKGRMIAKSCTLRAHGIGCVGFLLRAGEGWGMVRAGRWLDRTAPVQAS